MRSLKTVTLGELAQILRSKDAQNFYTAIDIFFDSEEKYEMVKGSGSLTVEQIAKLYKIPEDNVEGIYFVDHVWGIKISLLRKVAADDVDSTDILGAQQHIPLIDLEISDTLGGD